MRKGLAALQARWLELEEQRLSAAGLTAQAAVGQEQLDVEADLLRLDLDHHDFHADKILPDPIALLPDLDLDERANWSFAVVGAGVSGLCMAARLRQAGFDNFEILEKAPAVGGVWHHNKYPGLACDVPAQYYSFSFFRNPNFKNLFASGEEIQGYLQSFADHFGLTDKIAFNSAVLAAWREDGKWVIDTDDGRTRRVDFLILANGFLHSPKIPDLPGLESFAKTAMHSSAIPKDFDFTGKRVGNIGTGSTTVQITTNLVDKVDRLTVFQRTPQWVFPVANETYSDQRLEVLARNPELTGGLYKLFMDRAVHGLSEAVVTPDSPNHGIVAAACTANLAQVRDPGLRQKLTPNYAPMCKRLVISAKFFESVQRPNCELVTEAIERIEPGGVRTKDGVLRELDVLILSTGYDIKGYQTSYSVDNGGALLTDAWAGGVRSLDSVAVAGFPNMFMLGGAHATVGNFSIMSCAEEQSGHIIRLVGEFCRAGARALVPKPEAEDRFVAEMASGLPNTVWVRGGCQSWYLNQRGGVDFWTLSIGRFVDRMREEPDLSKFELSYSDE